MLETLLKTARIAGFALVAGLGLASQASAAPVDFQIDLANSSVGLVDTGGTCFLSNCRVEVAFASGAGAVQTINPHSSSTFDFLTFRGRGTGSDSFALNVALSFLTPSGTGASGTGTGGAALLFGNIVAGLLTWTDVQFSGLPSNIDASIFFQGGPSLFQGNTVTTDATISVASVPLPAGGLLLVGAMGGLAALRRRKIAA